MTTEQKEAIDRLKELVELRKSKNKIKYDNCICATSDVDIVLNLIKKQENELKKKDKIIDELAKAFKQDDVRNVEEIKRFFEKQAKEKGEKYEENNSNN